MYHVSRPLTPSETTWMSGKTTLRMGADLLGKANTLASSAGRFHFVNPSRSAHWTFCGTRQACPSSMKVDVPEQPASLANMPWFHNTHATITLRRPVTSPMFALTLLLELPSLSAHLPFLLLVRHFFVRMSYRFPADNAIFIEVQQNSSVGRRPD